MSWFSPLPPGPGGPAGRPTESPGLPLQLVFASPLYPTIKDARLSLERGGVVGLQLLDEACGSQNSSQVEALEVFGRPGLAKGRVDQRNTLPAASANWANWRPARLTPRPACPCPAHRSPQRQAAGRLCGRPPGGRGRHAGGRAGQQAPGRGAAGRPARSPGSASASWAGTASLWALCTLQAAPAHTARPAAPAALHPRRPRPTASPPGCWSRSCRG